MNIGRCVIAESGKRCRCRAARLVRFRSGRRTRTATDRNNFATRSRSRVGRLLCAMSLCSEAEFLQALRIQFEHDRIGRATNPSDLRPLSDSRDSPSCSSVRLRGPSPARSNCSALYTSSCCGFGSPTPCLLPSRAAPAREQADAGRAFVLDHVLRDSRPDISPRRSRRRGPAARRRAPRSSSTSWNGRTSRSGSTTGCRIASPRCRRRRSAGRAADAVVTLKVGRVGQHEVGEATVSDQYAST